MGSTSRALSCALIAFAAACGDDGGSSNPDAPDTTIDAPIDAPPLPGGCDYAELRDATNDDVEGAGTPETTGKTLATSVTLCGQVDTGHFSAADGIVDIDGFAVNLPPGRIRVTVSGAGLEALEKVVLGVYSGTGFGDIEGETTLHGTHVFYMDSFTTGGAVEFAVITVNNAAPGAAIPYKIVITVDDPSLRCTRITAPANHTEGTDTGNTSNDVVDINFGAGANFESLSPAATDLPEVATGGTIGATTNYRITGNLATATVVGSYRDRDTFSFMTGATTDELSVRINWTGSGDLDMFLYEAAVPPTGAGTTNVGTSQITATTEDEFKTFAVKPNTTYWLWTGLHSSLPGPIAYSLSLCGADFTPP